MINPNMKNSIFKLAISHGLNIALTILWAPFVILPGIALFIDEMDDFFWQALFIAWIIQVFVTLFVHGIFLIPSYFWQATENSNLEESYLKAMPILLIPTAIYLCLTGILLVETMGGEDILQMIIAAMFCFITIYSLSLYTLLQKILKQNSDEKINH